MPSPPAAILDAARAPEPSAAAGPTIDPLTAARMEEVQHIVDDGAAPGRLARVISEYAGEPASLIARRTALAALRTVHDRPARLRALLEAGHAAGVRPEDDPLWPDLVQSVSETWAAGNTAGGRARMGREKDPRTRLLLIASLAVYAASNRGLSEMTPAQRRALRAEFMRCYPSLPEQARRQIDAFVARIDVNAWGTLP